MTTPLQPAPSGHEECPQCKYPHFAAGHQRCISCGWVRGSEIAPRFGRPEFDVRANAMSSLLPGDPSVSIEQRIQAQSAILKSLPTPPPPPVASIPEPQPAVLPPSPEPEKPKENDGPKWGKSKLIQ